MILDTPPSAFAGGPATYFPLFSFFAFPGSQPQPIGPMRPIGPIGPMFLPCGARYAIIARHSLDPALNSDNAQTSASSRSGLDWFSAGL